jgi:hypothetical protein
MSNKITFGIASLLVLVFSAFFVSAAGVCSLGLGTKAALYTGDTTTASFVNLYLPPNAGNITLDISGAPGITITAGSNPQDLVAFGSMANWDLYISSAGTKTITASMVDAVTGATLCSNTTTFTVVPYANMTVSLSNLTSIVVNDPANFMVVLNSRGPGNATSISGILMSSSGAAIAPSTISLARLNAGLTSPSMHTVTPTACGTGDSVAITVSYRDENGVLMTPPAQASDSFNVVGSDMAFTTISATPSTFAAGATTTFSASVHNMGTTTAENVRVTFSVDGVAVSTQVLGNILVGASATATYAYTTSVSGTHALTASLAADHECSDANNIAPSVAFTVTGGTPSPFCGDGSCNGAETCSSCSADCGSCSGGSGGGGGGGGGGNAGRIYYLVLTAEHPTQSLYLRSGDTVKYTWNREEFSFPIRYVFSDKAKMGVSRAAGYKEYSLDENVKYNLNLDDEPLSDLGVRPTDLYLGAGNFTFDLLQIPEKKPIFTLPFLKKKVKTVETNQTAEVAGEPEVVEPVEEKFSEGVLEFIESVNVKSSAPLWAGVGVALLVILLGLGAYFFATRKKE